MIGRARATILLIDSRAPGQGPPARPDHGVQTVTAGADPGGPCDRRGADLHPGARRQGALNLRLCDLDPTRSTVWLREKDGTDREQPLSPTLLTLLERHAHQRAARSPKDPVFRHRNGHPLSTRRYNTIFDHARTCLEWTDRTPVSAHVLRHTAITAIGRLAGYPIAQAFAGHAPPSITGHYMQATIEEVATAIATLPNQPHPLAQPDETANPQRRHCNHQQPRA